MKTIQLKHGGETIVDDDDGLRHCLGHFEIEIDAAKAYNQKAEELFGEYAHPNQIPA